MGLFSLASLAAEDSVWAKTEIHYEVIDHSISDPGFPEEATLIIVFYGEAAKKLYEQLPVEPIHDECLEVGQVKFNKDLYCRANAGDYECRIGVGLKTATIKNAYNC